MDETAVQTDLDAALYELDVDNRKRLMSSAPLVWDWSRTACMPKPSGGMEEWAKVNDCDGASVDSCGWYHGTWQLLRLLNMVAVPPWYGFYNKALSRALADRPAANILISAAADYGMLCTLHEAIVTSRTEPKITLCDICSTPIIASQWYADRYGLTIDCIRDDLLTTGQLAPESFDLIVTDELLTVLKAADKPLIVDRWMTLLKPGGVVVTTAMIGRPTTPELRERYAERARRLLNENADSFQMCEASSDDLIERFERFAQYHTRHMITDEAEIRDLFARFNMDFTVTVTPGECVNPTSSFQIVAAKSDSFSGNGRG